jgi:hypothetical protein
MTIPDPKPPHLTPLAKPRGLPSIPHVGCVAGQGVSCTGEQYGDVPDVRAIGLCKLAIRCLTETKTVLDLGAAADAELTSSYSSDSSAIAGKIAAISGELSTLINQVTTETNALISAVNAKIAVMNSARTALVNLPSGQRSKVQQLMIDRYARYASELSAQAGHLAATASCLGS